MSLEQLKIKDIMPQEHGPLFIVNYKNFFIILKLKIQFLKDEIEKCKLWCIPLYGETNIVSFGLDVVDGTKCDRYSYDICVNGNCHVGSL